MRVNPLLLTDSYKLSHPEQYPPDMNMAIAYGSCRKGLFELDPRIVQYGLRYIIDNYMVPITQADLDEAVELMSGFGLGGAHPFPKELIQKVIDEHNGIWPVTIEAFPEGSIIYPHMPVYQITATDEFAPLVTYIETMLTRVWYPITVATIGLHARNIIHQAFIDSVDESFWFLEDSRVHDFGARGCTTHEQAMLGGSAHGLHFTGSDNLEALRYVRQQDPSFTFTSIPATEHSVMTSWRSEEEALENMLNHYPGKVFATVADSYNYDNYINNIVPKYAKRVIETNSTLVVRPDSGDPIRCVVDALKALAKVFPTYKNSKGYRVIEHAAVIQGDGIDLRIMGQILEAVLDNGFSAQNVAFGLGAGLLHKHNRDTLSFATKLCFARFGKNSRTIQKRPATDKKKSSLPGPFGVYNGTVYRKIFVEPNNWATPDNAIHNELVVAWHPVRGNCTANLGNYEMTRMRINHNRFSIPRQELNWLSPELKAVFE